MALDGIAVSALQKELNEKLVGARIDKIYQPDKDELLIFLRGINKNFKLKLSANASIPCVSLAEDAKTSGDTPPVFCMLLRKHLCGAKIVSVCQPDFERVLKIYAEGYNELGDLTQKVLIIELMGKYSNIILTDDSNKILDSIKRVDFSVSSVRQILPGLIYEGAPSQGKKNPLLSGTAEFLESLDDANESETADRALLNNFAGVSPIIAREIVYRALGDCSVRIGELDMSKKLDVATTAYRLFCDVKNGKFTPCYFIDKNTGKHIDFCAVDILQYENMAERRENESMAVMIDEYYRERSRREKNARRNADLLKLVSNHIERCAKKIELQTRELSDTEKKDKWKEAGELITANLYRIKQGDEYAEVENFYEENSPTIKIKLDTTLTPSANAQKYFKKYNKAKTAAEELTKQIGIAEKELFYLESVEEEIEKAQSGEELSEIAEELFDEGYIKRNKGEKRKKTKMSLPLEGKTADGFTVLVGRNNKQNDYLTCKMAHNNDLWFHTKNIHGSHVVLRYENEREFTDDAIIEAARLAAKYSKASESENVPVDYTPIKFVKKPAGAKPGFVIYTTNKTVYVTP